MPKTSEKEIIPVRDVSLADITDEKALDILSKAESAFSSLWEEGGYAEPGAIAEFYQIPVSMVEAEIISSEFKQEMYEGLLTPRAALRLGLKLDNEIGANIRTIAIDVCQVLAQKQIREKIAKELKKLNNPEQVSDRQISRMLFNSPGKRNTVARVREELEESGEIPVRKNKSRKSKDIAAEDEVQRGSGRDEELIQERSINLAPVDLDRTVSTEKPKAQAISLKELSYALPRLDPRDLLTVLKNADQHFTDEHIASIEAAIAHRRVNKVWEAL